MVRLVDRTRLLALAEAMAADPQFGIYTDRRGERKPVSETVYQGILKVLLTLAGSAEPPSREEILQTLEALPRSSLASGSRGLPDQYSQVLEQAFGLRRQAGRLMLRKELQEATLQDLIYYAGWLVRLTLPACRDLYFSEIMEGRGSR